MNTHCFFCRKHVKKVGRLKKVFYGSQTVYACKGCRWKLRMENYRRMQEKKIREIGLKERIRI